MTKKTFKIATFILGLASFCNLILTSNSFAVGELTSIKDFSADYYLSRTTDGQAQMRVVENILADFTNTTDQHGLRRVLPYTNNNGKNLTFPSDQDLEITVWRNGQIEPIDHINVEEGYFEIFIGQADQIIDGRQLYRLEYTVTNPVLDFNDYQELTWDANGIDWETSFTEVSATVHLDDSIKQSFDGEVVCYMGEFGSLRHCGALALDDGAIFIASNLPAGHTLTFSLKFDPDTFMIPARPKDLTLVGFFTAMVTTGIFIILLGVLTWHATREKRVYYHGLFTKPEYTPPKGFTVAEMAQNHFGSHQTNNQKVAELIELAVQDKIQIIQSKPQRKSKHNTWTIRVLTTNLTADQTLTLKLLSGKNHALRVGQEISLETSSTNPALLRLEQDYNEALKNSLEQKGLWQTSQTKKSCNQSKPAQSTINATKPKNYAAAKEFCTQTNLAVLIAVTALWLGLNIFAFCFLLDQQVPYRELVGAPILCVLYVLIVLVICVFVIISCVYNYAYSLRTAKGLEYSRYLDGLKLYIKMAEQDRIEFLQSVKGADTSPQGIVHLYEKLLPYAILFGLEKTWLRELEHYYETQNISAPSWYVSPYAFSMIDFQHATNRATQSFNSILHSGLSSSSSSGSSFGGGFAGSGGGGGGGGSW